MNLGRLNRLLSAAGISPASIRAFWLVWGMIASSALAVLAMTALSPLHVPGIFAAYLALLFVGFQLLAWVVLRMKDGGSVFMILQAAIQFSIGAVLLIILVYQGAALAFPLVDTYLDAADHMLGFNWKTYMGWLDLHPTVGRLLVFSYFTLIPQIFFFLIFLGVCSFTDGQLLLQRFIFVYLVTLAMTAVLATLWPAMAYYFYYGITPVASGINGTLALAHVEHMQGLRSGAIHVMPLAMKGVVTFPSFHASAAVLLIWAGWPVRRWRLIGLYLNLLMIISCLSEGGHYLVDILAGIALALLGIYLADRVIPCQKPV